MPTRAYQVTLTTAPTLICWYLRERVALQIRNDSGATIYESNDPTVSTTTGNSLATGQARLWLKKFRQATTLPRYGLVAAATATISVEETIADED